ncbi:hypothetical protein [Phormidium sp. CCY1219]|uniref:hypothetical protein n=1 Tax=Phormidium sp. CCY1219 TaxID=2886104 RepID=UPI002D1F9585|nr:hypothetical protein [Phormidium sp. CCY1219]MEB3826017.1 hypothetical protein [Phormidium sp. CCY1219]
MSDGDWVYITVGQWLVKAGDGNTAAWGQAFGHSLWQNKVRRCGYAARSQRNSSAELKCKEVARSHRIFHPK